MRNVSVSLVRSIDWLIDWLIDYLFAYITLFCGAWLIDWVLVRSINRSSLIDWLIDWLFVIAGKAIGVPGLHLPKNPLIPTRKRRKGLTHTIEPGQSHHRRHRPHHKANPTDDHDPWTSPSQSTSDPLPRTVLLRTIINPHHGTIPFGAGKENVAIADQVAVGLAPPFGSRQSEYSSKDGCAFPFLPPGPSTPFLFFKRAFWFSLLIDGLRIFWNPDDARHTLPFFSLIRFLRRFLRRSFVTEFESSRMDKGRGCFFSNSSNG